MTRERARRRSLAALALTAAAGVNELLESAAAAAAVRETLSP